MKKIISVCFALVLLIGLTLAAFAESGEFVQSPFNNQAPELIEGKNESEDCPAQLRITAYSDKEELPEEIREELENAYKMILENSDLSSMNDVIGQIADDLDVLVEDLAVSSMFDISAMGCGAHENHGHFDITLKAEDLENFVCLLHYYNDEWRVVDNAVVTNNGTHLEFDEDEFSPFAIVVNAAEEQPAAPQTNDNAANCFIIPAILGLLLIIFIIIIVFKRKKKEA